MPSLCDFVLWAGAPSTLGSARCDDYSKHRIDGQSGKQAVGVVQRSRPAPHPLAAEPAAISQSFSFVTCRPECTVAW